MTSESEKDDVRSATALRKCGDELLAARDLSEALVLYDRVIDRFIASTEPALCEQLARALNGRGFVLCERDHDTEAAINIYDDIVTRFGTATEPELREQAARALFDKGFVLLYRRGQGMRAISAYEDIVARFGKASELALREWVARALFNKAHVLGQAGRSGQAISVYGNIVARFGKASDPALREWVARALVGKGDALSDRKWSISAYDEVIARFGSASEPALREHVAHALFFKGIVLDARGDKEEAISAYGDIIARFGKASEPALRRWVARALDWLDQNQNAEAAPQDDDRPATRTTTAGPQRVVLPSNIERLDDARRRRALEYLQSQKLTPALITQDQINIDERENLSYSIEMNIAAFAARARTLPNNKLQEFVEIGDVAAAILKERGATTAETPVVLLRDATVPEEDLPRAPAIDAAAEETTSRNGSRLKWGTHRETDENPAHFAVKAYAAEIAAGTFDKSLIRRDDKTLYQRLFRDKAWAELETLMQSRVLTKSERRQASQIEAMQSIGLEPEKAQRAVAVMKRPRPG